MSGFSPAVQSFMQEASDILETLDQTLLQLEAEPTEPGLIGAVFRALHTLKGSGAMFGFISLAEFLHHFENVFDRIRAGQATVTPELIQISLAAHDHLQRMVSAGPDPEGVATPDPDTAELVERIEALALAPATDEPAKPDGRSWLVTFRPEASALRNGMRPDLLVEELVALGDAEVSIDASDVPALLDLDPSICYLSWRVTLRGPIDRAAIEDVFIFATDGDLAITALDAPSADTPADPPDGPDQPPQTSAAVAAPRVEGTGKADSVRVQSRRLDEQMDQLGELVIAQARLNRISHHLGDAALEAVAEEIERLVTGLRDATLSIRMLPIELVFGKFRRVVRDLSTELGKQVRLETRGGETEVDKNVIDSLTEPLVHVIRNAIDHGIETPEARAAAGKPEQSRVALQARQAGGEVLISVTDDGAGLDAEAIRVRAVERGLIDADQDVSEEQLHQLIFEPGFSTAKTLSSVSGRGVGMDAVRRVIDDLRGTVEVRSRRGEGTRVTLRLPLTLAIIDGLLVRVGGDPFVLPLSAVEECVELPAGETERGSGRAILRIRDALVPYLMLDTLFGFETGQGADRRVVITSVDGKRTGLVVDEVVGQYQTVIKPLSVYHRGIEGLAGSTILGDGAVALILDAPALVKRAQARQRAAA